MPRSDPPLPPGVRFLPTDFERFRPEVQSNPEYNAERLEVRRKLDAIGKHLCRKLEGERIALTARASLHHPYRFNRFQVDSQWVYLSRAEKERRLLKRILGVELGEDLDQNYVHVLLVLEIHQHGLEIALRVHKDAWWDGENIKRRLAAAAERESFAALLRSLAGYGLHIHDYRNVHACGTMTAEEVANTIQYYKPGEHWLHIERAIPRDDPWIAADGLLERLEVEFRRLLPVYGFIGWSPSNNFLFQSAGGARP